MMVEVKTPYRSTKTQTLKGRHFRKTDGARKT